MTCYNKRQENLMNFASLNEMIAYIEDNLDNNIDFKKISQITNTNIFILQRIFNFLMGITINEYIKKRRLSKAFEDIRNTDLKIIDIAFKYQYNSQTSFNRAFKKMFSIAPTECRKRKGKYQLFPMAYFEPNEDNYNLDYQIMKMDSCVLYCYHIFSDDEDELLYEIKKLYEILKQSDIYLEFNKVGMYGIHVKENNMFHYYLGSTKYYPDLETFALQKGNYIIFKLPSRRQQDIVNLECKISRQWVPATNYKVNKKIKIEKYQGEYCYIYLFAE